jgi:hypothetical protein
VEKMKRTEAQAKYKWDFSHLYKKQPMIEKKDLEKNWFSIVKEIATLKGKLNDEKSFFFQYLELDEKIRHGSD